MKTDGKLRVLEILGKGQESVAAEVELWKGATVETQPLAKAKARGKFDAIVANHVLQQVPRFEVVPTLKRWAGWLKEGGQLHLTAPDLMWVCESVMREHQIDSVLLGVMYGTGEIEHRSGFSVLTLRGALGEAGLVTTAARTGPYTLLTQKDGEVMEVIGRQMYVVAVRQ